MRAFYATAIFVFKFAAMVEMTSVPFRPRPITLTEKPEIKR